MTQVKICGLRDSVHVRAAVEAGADLIGFIFYPPVRRYIEPRQVRAILDEVPRNGVEVVGVFVNETASRVAEIGDLLDLDLIQLSGDEPPELTRAIERPVVRTVHVDETTTLEDVRARAVGARLIHLDARRQGSYGGTGQTLDWGFARDVGALGSVLLAGGLDPSNVVDAIETARPWGVDVSSGVETEGLKDAEKIYSFVRTVKQ